MNYHEEIGERVRNFRKKKKKTQTEFANELDISPSYFGQLERGERIFTVDMLHKIAEKNDISIMSLLCDENEWIQRWYLATKDLELENKKELLNAFLIILECIQKKNK